MKSASAIFAEIRALAALPRPVRKPSTAEQTDRATARLAENVLTDLLPDASAEWLGPVSGFFEELVAKAQDRALSDSDLVDVIHRAALSAPELFQRVDADALARALEQAMGPAVLNGALQDRTGIARPSQRTHPAPGRRGDI